MYKYQDIDYEYNMENKYTITIKELSIIFYSKLIYKVLNSK